MLDLNGHQSFGIFPTDDSGNTEQNGFDRVTFMPIPSAGDIPEFLEHRSNQLKARLAKLATELLAISKLSDACQADIRNHQEELKRSGRIEVALQLAHDRAMAETLAMQARFLREDICAVYMRLPGAGKVAA